MKLFNECGKYIFLLFAIFFIYSCGEKPQQEISKPLYELAKNYNIPKFDSENAYNQVKAQVNFGPRNPNSKGHEAALNYLQNELKKYCDDVQLQSFTYSGYNDEKLNLTNIIGRFNPAEKNRIILCAHWDTRPRAEKAEDPKRRNEPILGANDGGSGVGVILEMAKILKTNKINYGVDLVLFDGEDYGKESDLDNFCLGSKYFAVNYKEPNYPAFSILLDLVGDKEAEFKVEGNSKNYAPEVIKTVWGIASQINANMFSQQDGSAIYDDHIPLNRAGLKTIDIIDMELVGADTPVKRRNYWHTHKDTMNNIGKNALQQVGDVLTHLIYSLQFNY
ncbi:MAG TPA: M28 family peptidase [Ignavibacteriaceae bacterium]|nr:M28 family peptidase [Ignavibacteriaceae bacterium]